MTKMPYIRDTDSWASDTKTFVPYETNTDTIPLFALHPREKLKDFFTSVPTAKAGVNELQAWVQTWFTGPPPLPPFQYDD